MRLPLYILCSVMSFTGSVYAETITTNLDSVVIKNPLCINNPYDKFNRLTLYITISNRSNLAVTDEMLVTAFDTDGDPVENAIFPFSLAPVSGDRYSALMDCQNDYKYAARLKLNN